VGRFRRHKRRKNRFSPFGLLLKLGFFSPTSEKPKRSIFSRGTKERQIQYPLDFPDFANGPKPQQQDVKDENAKTDCGFIFLEKLPETLQGRGSRCLLI
jgi:hypothetical protein